MKNTIFATLLLLTSAVIFAQDKTISKSFSDVKSIRLNTASGDITLKKASGKEVKVEVKYSFDDNEFEAVMEQGANQLTLEEKFANGSHSGNSRWTLEVPDNTRIKINTGSGDITIDQLTLDIKSNSGSGDVTLTGVKGEMDFNTGSGEIELNEVDGEVSLNTGSGTIRASKGTGSYSFNAGSGKIKLDELKGDFSVNVGSGDIDAKGVTLTGSSSFNSGSGDSRVTLGSALDYSISVNSGSGNSTLNFGGNAISGEVIMTANKRGGEIIAPFKFDKEETIDDNNRSNERIQKTAKLGSKNISIKVATGSGTAEIAK
jgi:hypothetical protein